MIQNHKDAEFSKTTTDPYEPPEHQDPKQTSSTAETNQKAGIDL